MSKLRPFPLVVVLLLLAGQLASAQVEPGSVRIGERIDLVRIVGRTPAQVAAYLGKPSYEGIDRESVYHPKRKDYKGGAVEVEFFEGKADWVTIWPKGMPFSGAATEMLGLPHIEPTFASSAVIRWANILGIRTVQITPMHGGVQWVQVATKRDWK